MKIPLASLGLRDKDIESAIECLKSGKLTMGNKVIEFESKIAKYLKSEHFVMMNSGSSANLAMFEALLRPVSQEPYLKRGDGILVPAIAWPTTIWPILQLGLKPIFVDVDFKTMCIDLEQAQQVINNSSELIKGIFPIHILGYSMDASELTKFCEKNNLVLLNDVCESLGSWRAGIHAGICGKGGSFSFYFSHHITTMEGGGVATNDDCFADDLRSIRSHGWSRDRSDAFLWTENVEPDEAKFTFISSGFNVRPMEVQAAIGISQLEDLDKFIARRREIVKKVDDVTKGSFLKVRGAETLMDDDKKLENSWMLIPIAIEDKYLNIHEKKIITSELNKVGIETRPVLTGNFLRQPGAKKIFYQDFDYKLFENANKIADSTFLISCHHSLTDIEIEYLIEKIKNQISGIK
jgi:CDP-6-deoxy-D-xylo-4-hexulose-3-dehydrase